MTRINCAAIANNLDNRFLCDLIRLSGDPAQGFLRWKSLASLDTPSPNAARLALYRCGHQEADFLKALGGTRFRVPQVEYHADPRELCESACAQADVILCWQADFLLSLSDNTDAPIVNVIDATTAEARELASKYADVTPYHVATSAAARDCFPTDMGYPVQVIHRGVDPTAIAPKKGRAAQRGQWGIDDERRVLLLVGHGSDFGALSKALAALPQEWIGLVYGAGGQSKILDQLQDEARRYLHDRVCFIEGSIHNGDLYAAADCLLAIGEVDSSIIASAWLCGCPVVTDDSPFAQEIEAACGLALVQKSLSHNRDDLVDAIETTQSEPFAERLAAARQIAWSELTLPAAAHQWEQTITAIVDDWRSARQHPRIVKLIPEGGLPLS